MRLLQRNGAALISALALAYFAAPTTAYAAVTGNIAGVVTDQATGKALAGVTVTVSGPALQGEQTEFTDSAGRYIITELPPGEYVVRFYFSNIKVERPGVVLQADKTLPVHAAMPTATAQTKTYRIVERAPTVDVGNTQVQTQITNELVRNTPIQGRTYESVLTLAPGAATDAVGFSFNGATGPENNFLIDGLNTTNPAFGLVGTHLSLEFIAETEIITGGYNAEYGRATGGVVNVITKSGSNEFHGGAWFYYTPFQLGPETVARSGEAIGRRTKISNAFDFGFDLGGPIVKDRVWFYVGFAPQFETDQSLRILRHRTADDMTAIGMAGKSYAGDIDKSQTCPSWLAGGSSGAICQGLAGGPSTGPFKTVEFGTPTNFPVTDTRYHWIAKLNFALNENNNIQIHYIGSPENQDLNSTFNGDPSFFQYKQANQTHDVGLHYISKLLDRKLQLDLLVGYHYESESTQAATDMAQHSPAVFDVRTQPLTLFDQSSDVTANCAKQMIGAGMNIGFNPCPVSVYNYGGGGFQNDLVNQRISGALALTYFARLAGTHAIKLGGDFEDNIYKDHRYYTGGEIYEVRSSGQTEIYREFGTVVGANSMNPMIQALNNCTGDVNDPKCGFTATTSTLNEGFYLRDSYNVGFVPGLTVNAGLRWELQQVQDTNGHTQISLTDNIAPRVGFVYDFTRKGRSKLFASYGRFYESFPLDINDRQFSGEGLLIKRLSQSGATMQPQSCWGNDAMGAAQKIDPSTCLQPAFARGDLNGGTFGVVSPKLQGQYSNEVVAGLQYDVGLDLVLGATYIHRDLGRIVEDMSPDGGINYIIANPGSPTDQGTVQNLQSQIKATSDPTQKAQLQQQLSLYQSVQSFSPPKRDYNALVLTASKRLSHNFIVLASYTYSRTLGNYPGLFNASNGQLDPNISSQYDLKELLLNRDGPLPEDRPHNLKLLGSYIIPLGAAGGITIGAQFNTLSGTPIEVLGQHPLYGRRETFILPRGSGGRTPTVTQLDLHVAYGRQFSKLLRVDIYWDTFNVLNEHTVTAVDQEYTTDFVLPMVNGTVDDLRNLKNLSGQQVKVSSNYGSPTAYQSPLSMRFGLRVSF